LQEGASAVGPLMDFCFETHVNPSVALSDGANMIKLDLLYSLVEELNYIQAVSKLRSSNENY